MDGFIYRVSGRAKKRRKTSSAFTNRGWTEKSKNSKDVRKPQIIALSNIALLGCQCTLCEPKKPDKIIKKGSDHQDHTAFDLTYTHNVQAFVNAMIIQA